MLQLQLDNLHLYFVLQQLYIYHQLALFLHHIHQTLVLQLLVLLILQPHKLRSILDNYHQTTFCNWPRCCICQHNSVVPLLHQQMELEFLILLFLVLLFLVLLFLVLLFLVLFFLVLLFLVLLFLVLLFLVLLMPSLL